MGALHGVSSPLSRVVMTAPAQRLEGGAPGTGAEWQQVQGTVSAPTGRRRLGNSRRTAIWTRSGDRPGRARRFPARVLTHLEQIGLFSGITDTRCFGSQFLSLRSCSQMWL